MPAYPNVLVPLVGKGPQYAVNVPLTAPIAGTDQDLFNQLRPDPAGVFAARAVIAVVTFTPTAITTNSSYVILQTDLGDGRWIDLAWCVYTGLTTATFCLTSAFSVATVFQQTRSAGTAPSSNGSNAVPLGDRIRFIGAATTSSSSSSSSSSGSPGVIPGVTVTIGYKLVGLR
jgi:hypothetical protein